MMTISELDGQDEVHEKHMPTFFSGSWEMYVLVRKRGNT